MLHVVADARGEWGVFEDTSRRPLSVHRSAKEAELVAWDHAKDRGSEQIVVHDRQRGGVEPYMRLYAIEEDGRWGIARSKKQRES